MAPAISTPVGPPPTMTVVSRRRRPPGSALALGVLVREQHPAPHPQRIVQRLQPGRDRGPFGMAEVRVRRAGRDDQVVVFERLAVVEQRPGAPCTSIACTSPSSTRTFCWRRRIQRIGDAMSPGDSPPSPPDTAGLKYVVVVTIDERHLHGRAPEASRAVQPAKSSRRRSRRAAWPCPQQWYIPRHGRATRRRARRPASPDRLPARLSGRMQPDGRRPRRTHRRDRRRTRQPRHRGYICAKVRRFPERVYGPDRLLYPLCADGTEGRKPVRARLMGRGARTHRRRASRASREGRRCRVDPAVLATADRTAC